MKRFRNGLLISALFSWVACGFLCGPLDAHALQKLSVEPAPQTTGTNPDAGEPDAGNTRTTPKSTVRPTSEGTRDTRGGVWVWDGDYLRWVSRLWIARYLGTGL
jgi:hypothetical protein